MTATSRALVVLSLAGLLCCAPARHLRIHGRIDPLELEPRPSAAPPDFSTAPNISVVAKGGSSWETSVAISPVDPNVIVFGVIDSTSQARVTTYRSTDGGASWSDPQPMALTAANGKTYLRSADPVVIADADGSFYLAEILIVGAKGTFDGAVIGISRSTDDGRTWSTPAVVVDRPADGVPSQNDDKEWLAVDRESGTLTVGWAFFNVEGNHAVGNPTIYIAQSRDHGTTWSAPRAMRTDDLQLTQVATAPDGKTYLSYVDYAAGAYIVRPSYDGGATFGGEAAALADVDIEGWILPNSNTLSVTTHTLLADTSPGPHRGTLYLAAPERKAVLFTRSTDGGRTWSEPLRFSAGSDILMPALAVDPVNGDVVVSWLDRRDDPANKAVRVYAARSTDGGVTFSAPRAFSPLFSIAMKMGDYDTSAAMNGQAVRAFSTESGHASVVHFDFSPLPVPPRRRIVRH
jgi:hypothetical protein